MSGEWEPTLTYRFVDFMIGDEYVVKFRDDMKSSMYQHSSIFNNWDAGDPHLRSKANQGYEKANASNWNFYTIILSVFGVATYFIGVTNFDLYISIFSLMLGIFSSLHKITVDMLLYRPPFAARKKFLKFKAAWNDGVLTSWKAVLILLIAFSMRYFPEAYRIGVATIEQHIKSEL